MQRSVLVLGGLIGGPVARLSGGNTPHRTVFPDDQEVPTAFEAGWAA